MKLFRKKTVTAQLSHADRIAAAQVEAQTALGLFQTAHDSLEKANNELSNVVIEAGTQLSELNQLINNAHISIERNMSAQRKLKDFIA